jgi:dephospho-CoA kinase
MRVGLTGGVASGKSTVSALLAELGAVVIDADLLAREVVAPGTDGLAEIVEAFGPGVLTPDGQLDRPAVGDIVFADEEKRRVLEAIIHPRVRERGRLLEADAPEGAVVVHDIPLLVETGQPSHFDAVVVVDVPVELQVQRMVELRGMSVADAQARIAAQATRDERLAAATHVIDNTGTLEDLEVRVAEVYDELVSRASPAR